jgi:predicted transcriptional regulator
MARRNSPSRILAAQRKQRCWELRQQHYTQQQIADHLGISPERVSQILRECVEEQDRQVLAAKDQYRKFLLAEAEATERRLYETLSLVPASDFSTRMKVEEQIRKNMELRAKLTAADRGPAVVITPAETVSIDVQKVLAEVDAWTPPAEGEHAEPVLVPAAEGV